MIRIRNLVKDYKVNGVSFGAVNGIDLDIPDGEFFTLLGPSGCGKSTLLRCISGLETPTEGEIEVDGTLVFSSTRSINIGPNKRKMGMVFQSYAIWPHMTVSQNVAFPLEVQKIGDRAERVRKALALVGLEKFTDRAAYRLSGGQQQRVALARAIVANPKTLLLDEPLSNLDAALRDQMRLELSKLHQNLRLTTVFVTHDQGEALSLSQSIAVMDAGKVVEVGSPETLYRQPQSLFSAEFLGASNIFRGDVLAPTTAGIPVKTGFGVVHVSDLGHTAAEEGGSVSLFIRPERIQVRRGAGGMAKNQFPGKVLSRGFLGHHVDLMVSLGDHAVLRCMSDSAEELAVGDRVTVSIRPEDVGVTKDSRRVKQTVAP
jgi:iron(III) transport system ATP-binding protein